MKALKIKNEMKFIRILFILIFLSQELYSQDYRVTYGKINSKSKDELNEITDVNVRNNVMSMINSFKLLEYELLIVDKSVARFNYVEKLDTPKINKRAIGAGGGGGIHFFNLDENLTIHKTELLGDVYFVEKKIDSYEWRIINESKEINGFTCYKAETSFSYSDFRGKGVIELVAWFCPEFPYPYGPDIYFGLPGLVFEAYKKNSAVKFYLKKIEKFENEINIEIPNKKTISEEEMTQIFNKVMNDLTNQN